MTKKEFFELLADVPDNAKIIVKSDNISGDLEEADILINDFCVTIFIFND